VIPRLLVSVLKLEIGKNVSYITMELGATLDGTQN
jgi:hypothetical protein